ncbi:hypothetical protein [Empedobacter sp. UBA7248]|uniref:hypothetical protein n=1 Tax=Empedobacter sp. UBA7248 TaxID=1946448 RepID=UPI0025C6577D|nr:hypothetical protein [Empedobacter sp. UBA7248]
MRKFYFLILICTSILSNAQSYKQKEFRVNFPNGVPNQAVDVLLGNSYLNGWIEVNISGTYSNENSVGIIRKNFQVGMNPSNGVWNSTTSRIIEAEGLLVNNIYVGDIVWDNTINQYKLTIFHTKSSGNPYSIHVTQHSYTDAIIDQANLSAVYTNYFQGIQKHSVYYNNAIGIGVKDPKNMLDVNGTVHAKEVKVDMDGWADYVFKEKYDLLTLQEVEKHIQEKGHLPNIPSEKEVLENGISVGETQKLLLQKIEELTLYIIEQDKRIKELETKK